MVLAAPPAKASAVKAVIEANEANVKAEIEKLGWASGIAVLESCKEDIACYEKIMMDASKGGSSVRSGLQLRAACPNLATSSRGRKLAKAFKTRDPWLACNIAWLSAKVAGGTPCPECTDSLEAS